VFLLLAVLVGAITVPLAGGRLSRVPDASLRLPIAPVAAMALQGAIAVSADTPTGLLPVVHVLSYGIAALFVVANRRLVGMLLLGVGGVLNGVAVAVNGGVMPASAAAVARAGLVHEVGRFHNSAVVAEPRLAFLGDVFAIPASWPLATAFSVGDLLLFAAGVVLVHELAGSPWMLRLGAGSGRAQQFRRSGSPTNLSGTRRPETHLRHDASSDRTAGVLERSGRAASAPSPSSSSLP
jgi:hypothetical protein